MEHNATQAVIVGNKIFQSAQSAIIKEKIIISYDRPARYQEKYAICGIGVKCCDGSMTGGSNLLIGCLSPFKRWHKMLLFSILMS